MYLCYFLPGLFKPQTLIFVPSMVAMKAVTPMTAVLKAASSDFYPCSICYWDYIFITRLSPNFGNLIVFLSYIYFLIKFYLVFLFTYSKIHSFGTQFCESCYFGLTFNFCYHYLKWTRIWPFRSLWLSEHFCLMNILNDWYE